MCIPVYSGQHFSNGADVSIIVNCQMIWYKTDTALGHPAGIGETSCRADEGFQPLQAMSAFVPGVPLTNGYQVYNAAISIVQ